jgi:hypothetical protein
MRLILVKLPLTVGALIVMTACANVGPPLPPSLDLPKPPADLRAVRKGGHVLLSWTRPTTTTDRRGLHEPVPVLICRSFEASMSQCGTPVGRFTGAATLAGTAKSGEKAAPGSEKKNHEARTTDTYNDVLSNQTVPVASQPAGVAIYAIEALNANGRGAGLSNQVRVPLVETLASPQDFTATVSDQGVVLTWKGELPGRKTEGVHYVYRVYRRSELSSQQVLVGEAPADRERMTLSDANMEWEQTYYYHAEAVTIIEQPERQVEGDDSAEIKVEAHDVFPPAVPAELQAVFSGPGQAAFIDLIWAPVTDTDLAGYNVYRREGSAAAVRVNAELVKVPAYRDAGVGAGKSYSYSVTAVDVRGNESAPSAEAGESVP